MSIVETVVAAVARAGAGASREAPVTDSEFEAALRAVVNGEPDKVEDAIPRAPDNVKATLVRIAEEVRRAKAGEVDPEAAAKEVLRVIGLDVEKLIYSLLGMA